MEGIRLRPNQVAEKASVAGLAVLSALSLALAQLSLLWAAVMPLLVCPLMHHKQEKLCWFAACMPALGSLALVRQPVQLAYSFAMLLPCGLTMLFTHQVPLKKRMGPPGLMCYLAVYTLSMVLAWSAVPVLLGGTVVQTLPQLAVQAVEQSEQPGLVLYRLARLGLVSLPEKYAGGDILWHVMEPLVVREMLLSLRLTLEMLLPSVVPALFVQICLIVGLFTALRVERMNGIVLVVETDPLKPSERKTRVLTPPGFGMLAASRGLHLALTVMGVASLMLAMAEDAYTVTLAQLMYQTFHSGYALLGAAVVCGTMCMRRPDRRIPAGILAAALYVIAPFALVLLGVSDSFLNYRTRSAQRTDS